MGALPPSRLGPVLAISAEPALIDFSSGFFHGLRLVMLNSHATGTTITRFDGTPMKIASVHVRDNSVPGRNYAQAAAADLISTSDNIQSTAACEWMAVVS